MRMRDISLRVKLLASFLIIASLLVVTGYIGTSSLNTINMQSEIMYTDNLQIIDNLHEVRYKLMDNILSIKNTFDTDDLEKIVQLEDKINKNNKDSKSHFTIIEFKLVTGQEKELWKLFKERNNSLMKDMDILILELKRNNKLRVAEIIEELDLDYELMDYQLSRMIKENSTKARINTDKANMIYSDTVDRMNLVIIAGFILSVGLGIFFSKSITNEVTKGLHFAEALGSGNLKYNLEEDFGKDEIGQLIGALSSAQVKLKTLVLAIIDQSTEVFDSSRKLSMASEKVSEATSYVTHDFEFIIDDINRMENTINDFKDTTTKLESSIQTLYSNLDELKSDLGAESIDNNTVLDLLKNLEGKSDDLDKLNILIKELNEVQDTTIKNLEKSGETSTQILKSLYKSSSSLEEIRRAISSQVTGVEKLNSKINEFKI